MTILSIVARLVSEGYHSIRAHSTEPLQLWAINTEDREVLLTVNTQTGEISSADYVYAMGKNYSLTQSRRPRPPTDPSLKRAS
jgi:hypothetical protein